MKIKPLFHICVLLLLLHFSGCADKQDFNQFDDLQITPTAEASLLYVETPESLINQSGSNIYYSQEFNFDAFSEQFISEQVLDGVITYEVENTTSKELEITLEFLDEAGNVLDTETFTVPPAPTAVLRREIAYGGPSGRSLDILRNTSAIRVSGENLGDNSSVSNIANPVIILRSSAKIRLQLK